MDITRTTEHSADSQKLVNTVATEIWSDGHIELVDEVYADSLSGGIIGSYQFDGPDDYKSWIREARTAIPDLKITINKLLIGGAIVAEPGPQPAPKRGNSGCSGSNQHNETVEYDGKVIARLYDTNIVEEYHAGDYVTMLAQLDVLSR